MLLFFIAVSAWTSAADAVQSAPSPVLVELFTSEGCSSCPPADALLQRLDASQAVPGAEVIVLSEHVDYWNHDGWVDPYSSRVFTDRQNAYADRFGLATPYTPEMVVDGTTQFVGSDMRKASLAIEKARALPKVAIKLSGLSLENGVLRGHVEAGSLPENGGKHEAEVYLVLALNHAESQVQRGENQGRHLTHVAVVTAFHKLGTLEKGKSFSQDVRLNVGHRQDERNLRVIVIVQEPAEGLVLGATLQRLQRTTTATKNPAGLGEQPLTFFATSLLPSQQFSMIRDSIA
jgi:hypothetical protein